MERAASALLGLQLRWTAPLAPGALTHSRRHSWLVGHVQVEKESQEASQQRGLGPSQHSSSARTIDQDAWGWGDAQADSQRGAFLSPCRKMRTA